MRQLVIRSAPAYDFPDRYCVCVLRPHQRELDAMDSRPAWSITGVRKSDGYTAEFYCQEPMSHIAKYHTLYDLVLDDPFDHSVEVRLSDVPKSA